MQKPKMLVGQAGVRYGLQTRQPKPAGQPAGKLAAFGADSDSEEETVGAQVARQAARKVADSKVQEMYAAALAEDPNAFDYDGVYDSIQEQKAAPKQQDRIDRKPKYIANLLEQAQVRKREQDISYESRLLKERQKEDHMFDNEEKFITSAYRKKLEEDKLWKEQQRLKDLEDERNEVTKLGHMNNFFTNLNKNVALGGHQTAGAKQQQKQQQQQEAEDTAAAPSQAAEDPQQQQQQQRQQHDSEESNSSGDSDGSDKRHSKHQADAHQGAAADTKHDGRHHQQIEQRHPARPVAAAASAAEQSTAAEQQQQQQQAGGKRKNDDAAVAAARERYLARKRHQTGAQ